MFERISNSEEMHVCLLTGSVHDRTSIDSIDLRELLPNYVKPDSKVLHDEMIRKLSEQTASVYDSILSSKFEISVMQSPDLTNTIANNLFDDFIFIKNIIPVKGNNKI